MDAGLPIPTLPPAVERRLRPAGALLWFEAAWRHPLRWPTLGWAAFAILAVAGLWDSVPGTTRVAVLAMLALATIAAFALAARNVAPPSREAILRRIERASRLPRGRLALFDEPAIDLSSPFSAGLWGRARGQPLAAPVRLGPPRLFTRGERETALPALLAALALAVAIGGEGGSARLDRAFSPYAVSLAGVTVAATIEPPAYALRPARSLSLKAGGDAEVEALAGSRLRLRVDGPPGEWRLTGPDTDLELTGGNGVATLRESGRYTLRYGWRIVAALDIALAADGVPLIRFDGAPAIAGSGSLRIAYRLEDDLGASAIALELRHRGELRRIPLQRGAMPGKGAVFADLAADPFAGETVEMRLTARDGAGQTGHSETLLSRLPERAFNHPVAREVAIVRKALLRNPGLREAAAGRVNAISLRPERFGDDLTVYAGLRAAAWRLVVARDDPRAHSIARLLWDVALDIEDGGASRAMDALRETMDELAKAMATAGDREKAALADKLAAAMGEYLRRQFEAMAAEGLTQRQVETIANAARGVDASFLDAMLADLKDRLAAGDQAGAAAALANLRQMMESLQFGSGPGDPAAAKRAAAAAKGAEALRGLEASERDVQAETIAESVRRAVSGTKGPMGTQAEAQGAVERAVAKLEGELKQAGVTAPGAVGRAKQAMGAARAALAAGRPGDALDAQQRAIEALAEGATALDDQAKAEGQKAGSAGMPQPGQAGSGVDPLGRPGQGFGGGAVKLPDVERARRVEAIRKLLEERAADPRRSEDERAYYLRLLKRF